MNIFNEKIRFFYRGCKFVSYTVKKTIKEKQLMDVDHTYFSQKLILTDVLLNKDSVYE